jgi:hypothetical protein
MPQIDVLVLVCSGKYLLILDSYRSLYESNELMDMVLNTRNKSVKNETECRLLDYKVIFLKKKRKNCEYRQIADYKKESADYRLF